LLRRLNITSTFEYLEKRFGVPLRLFGASIGIAAQLLGRIGIVVMLPALAISTMTGMDPLIAILCTGAVTTLYSAAGGLEAVIWTDVIQGVLLTLGFISLGLLAFCNLEGGMDTLLAHGRELDRLNLFITEFDLTIGMMWFGIIGMILQLMSFASDQATAQRVLCTPMRDVRKLAFFSMGTGVVCSFIGAAVGLVLFAFFKSQPELLSPVMQNDQLVPLFIINKVPSGPAGLIVATLFAASMSTVSSSVNSCSVIFAEDFYKRFRKDVGSKEEMRVMQIATVVAGAVGTAFAVWLLYQPLPTLWEGFVRVMAMVGGGFTGVYALGMFTRRTHELGAIIGVVTGFVVAYTVQHIPFEIHYTGLMPITVGSCIISGYVSSLIIPWKRKPLTGLTIWDQISDKEAQARITAVEQE
jgi:SSS family transporter